jgi:hypothetical protein
MFPLVLLANHYYLACGTHASALLACQNAIFTDVLL